jgi:hypothetical protein
MYVPEHPPERPFADVMQLRKLCALLSVLLISGCGWVGVELQEPDTENVRWFSAGDIGDDRKGSVVIKLGESRADVVSKLGEPKTTATHRNLVILEYPSREKTRCGFSVCLVILSFPSREEKDGRIQLHFHDDQLSLIQRSTTKGRFYGLYMDDSGSGLSIGSISKCNV